MNKTTHVFRDETIFSDPIERYWLTEGKVEKRFNYAENVSYQMFLEYLRYLRNSEPYYWHTFQHINSKVKILALASTVGN